MGSGSSVKQSRELSSDEEDTGHNFIAFTRQLSRGFSNQFLPALKSQTQHHQRYKAKENKGLDSGRVSMNSTTSRGNRSVRAMALMNHARQENSYIPQEKLSASIRRNSKRHIPALEKADSVQLGSKSQEVKAHTPESAQNETEPNQVPIIKLEETNVQTEEEKEAPAVVGYSFLRNNLSLGMNLKININDEADWVQVDEEEEEDIASIGAFDNYRIEIPEEKPLSSVPIGKSRVILPPIDVSSSNKLSSAQDSPVPLQACQFNQSGTIFVDGFKGGIGANGIIKLNQDNSVRYTNKMSMKERLIVICKLGQGASSVVYKALDVMDMKLVALKMIHVHERDKRNQMIRELGALFQLIRENSRRDSAHLPKFRRPEKYIVDFYDAFSNLEDGMVAIMIEYMDGGSLQDIVDHGGCDDEGTLANIAIQALKGLDFLHSSQQLHRDLKPGNFLISHRGEVKVADLGIMKQFGGSNGSRGGLGQLPKATTFVGTATYMSPERIDGKEYSYPSDVWAFGLSLLSVALGRLPIETQGGYWTILHSIRDAPSPTLPAGKFSEDLVDFVDLCLKRKPEDRLSCKQLLKHRFLKKACPEDLTYAQSYNRGKSELLSIVQAAYTHIKQLKREAIEREKLASAGLLNPSSVTADDTMSRKIFGDLVSSPCIDILRKVLFGNDLNNSKKQQLSNGKSMNTFSAETIGDTTVVKPNTPSETGNIDTLETGVIAAVVSTTENSFTDISSLTEKLHNAQEHNQQSVQSECAENTEKLAKTKFKASRFTRPRLHLLAKQLHLPIERVMTESREYCDILEAEEAVESDVR